MDERRLRALLSRVRKGEASLDEAVAALVKEKLLLSVPALARGSGRACVEQLVAHAGSVALATRFTCERTEDGPGLEGLILVMPDPEKIAVLVGHLLAEQGD